MSNVEAIAAGLIAVARAARRHPDVAKAAAADPDVAVVVGLVDVFLAATDAALRAGNDTLARRMLLGDQA
jgi:hypothetical protein